MGTKSWLKEREREREKCAPIANSWKPTLEAYTNRWQEERPCQLEMIIHANELASEK